MLQGSVGWCVCADVKVHGRPTNTFSCSFNQDQKHEKWNLYVGFYVSLSKQWGGRKPDK